MENNTNIHQQGTFKIIMIHPDNGILNAIKGNTLYTDLEGSPRRIVKKKKI